MTARYQVLVFGKAGCDKCKVLNERLDKILEEPAWAGYEKKYCSLDTEEGLVVFCKAECIHPQRVPALLVTRWDEAAGAYLPVGERRPGDRERPFGHARLHHLLGLQTDYSETGKGVISPAMIKSVLQEAAT